MSESKNESVVFMPDEDVMNELFARLETADAARELGRLLRLMSASCLRRAQHLDVASFGGDGDILTFRSVGEAVEKLATEVEENGFVEVKP